MPDVNLSIIYHSVHFELGFLATCLEEDVWKTKISVHEATLIGLVEGWLAVKIQQLHLLIASELVILRRLTFDRFSYVGLGYGFYL